MFPPRRLERVFLFVCLALALGFVARNAVVRIEYLRFADHAAQMPAELASLPEHTPRTAIYPISSADSHWWVMHTEAMIRSGDWRVRETTRDNAPHGREVHWSSGLMWTLAGLAWLLHLGAGLETVSAVQQAALVVGPLMHLGFILVFGLVAARRWGGLVGGGLALGLASLGSLDQFFRPGEADHHGIVTCLALGCLLAALAAGAGLVAREGAAPAPRALAPSRRAARRWMILSGLLGAAGLWVSAATVIPLFAGIALGAVGVAWLRRGARAGETAPGHDHDYDAGLWRIWGASGALGGLAFYLLEYAPSHFGWRLEVNHPLYALAWWGGGELLARLCSWIRGGGFAPAARGRLVALAALTAVVALPATVLVGGPALFSVRDTFLWNLHEGYILEFRGLVTSLSGADWGERLATLAIWPLLALPAAWCLIRRRRTPGAALLALALGAALPLSALSFLQIRWLGVTQTLWLALLVSWLAVWRATPAPRPRLATAAGALLLLFGVLPFPLRAIQAWNRPSQLAVEEAISLVMRDIGRRLRSAAGSAPINVVSGPTTTTSLAFYGDTRGVGTLYWENLAGLKTVAAIYGAQSEAEALRLCRENAVTHIVVFSWDAFAQPYARLHHGRAVDAPTDDCFVSSLLNTRNIPEWLRPRHYTMLPELAAAGHWVLVFEVHPEQSSAEAYFHLGQYLEDDRHPKEALEAYLKAWSLDSTHGDIAHRLGLALANAGRVDEARQLTGLLPPRERGQILAAMGRGLLSAGRGREAVETFRAALAAAPHDRDATTDLAWVLATSDDLSIRDGAEALRLMGGLNSSGQSLTLAETTVLAAACAETGNFADALAVIDKAIDAARSDGDPALIERLQTYRSRFAGGLPLRESSRR
jgi:tetratricopeptide (TPR) repeat protein